MCWPFFASKLLSLWKKIPMRGRERGNTSQFHDRLHGSPEIRWKFVGNPRTSTWDSRVVPYRHVFWGSSIAGVAKPVKGTAVKTRRIGRGCGPGLILLLVVSCMPVHSSANESGTTSKPGGRNLAGDETAAPAGGLVDFVNQQLRQAWTDNEIVPSEPAADEEWVRRIYLDLCGRIPAVAEVRSFLEDKGARKRIVLIDTLLGHEDYVRNFYDNLDELQHRSRDTSSRQSCRHGKILPRSIRQKSTMG
jgi:hypothetical protein